MTDTLTLDVQIEQLRAQRDRLATGQVGGHDRRLSVFWERVGSEASDEGMCEVYDEIVDELGGTSREHVYDLDVSITVTLHTTLSETARSGDAAYDAIRLEDQDELFERMLERLGISTEITSHTEVSDVSIGNVSQAD